MTQFISDGINLQQETVLQIAKVILFQIQDRKNLKSSMYSYLGGIRATPSSFNFKQLQPQATQKETKLKK